MKRILFPTPTVLVVILWLGTVFGQVPRMMNYQGMLGDTSGTAISNGNYDLTFRIYDVASGGTPLWVETHSAVPVTKGLFQVMLGSLLPIDLPFDRDYWLGVQVGNELELSPRIRLVSVGYAFKADKADTAFQALNADKVNNIPARSIPTANALFPLGDDAKFPKDVLPSEIPPATHDHIGETWDSHQSNFILKSRLEANSGRTVYSKIDTVLNHSGSATGGHFYAGGYGHGAIGIEGIAESRQANAVGGRFSAKNLFRGSTGTSTPFGIQASAASNSSSSAYGGWFEATGPGPGDKVGIYAVASGGGSHFAGIFQGDVEIRGSQITTDVTTSKQFVSNVASGVPPYACSSTTLNHNLNADMVDGHHANDFLSANSDYGRPNVAENLYEGSTNLTNKYVNEGQANAITTDMIQNSQVTTEKIAANAVTSYTQSYGGNFDISSVSNDDLPGAYFTLSTTGGAILLNFNCSTSGYEVGEPTDVLFVLVIDAVIIQNTYVGSTMEGGGWLYTAGFTYISENLAPGQHTFNVQYKTKKGYTVHVNNFQFNAIELKR